MNIMQTIREIFIGILIGGFVEGFGFSPMNWKFWLFVSALIITSKSIGINHREEK